MHDGSISPKRDQRGELERLRSAVAASGDLVYDWDLVSDAMTWSGQVARVFGVSGSAAAPTGSDLERLVHPEDRLKLREARRLHFSEGAVFDCEYRVRTDVGEYCWVHDCGCAELTGQGEPVRFSGIIRLVTARKQTEASLEEKVSYDELTGHYNRARLRDALEHALAYAVRYQTSGGYFTVGVDSLTQINDAYGYEIADAVIVGLGQVLDRELRASDVVGRVEGDRFGIVLFNCSEEQVMAVAEKILNAVRARPIDTPAGPMQMTVSIGSMGFPTAPGQTAHDIMRRSEIALQEAKQLGRNCLVPYRFSADQQRERQKDMVIAKQVQQALHSGRLAFAFQPVVRSIDQGIEFYECLLRMKDEEGNIIPAAAFIPVVERMGLIRTIDHRVLEMAVDILHKDTEIVLAINVSGLTAGDRAWLRLLVSRLKGRPQLARRLIVEITETVALHDIEETAVFVATVRNLGCRVALDDFGAGYTSFRHLQALAVDMVKIDGSFVRDLANDLDNQLFVKTLLSLAEGFGLWTVAECVETVEDVAFLSKQGVRLLQGYYFGRPELEPVGKVTPGPAGSPVKKERRSTAAQPLSATS